MKKKSLDEADKPIKYWEFILNDGTILKDKTYRFIEYEDNYVHVYNLITYEGKHTKGCLWWKHEVKERLDHKEKVMILNHSAISRMIIRDGTIEQISREG